MIRFIDLRNQDTGYKFAFWDTVTDSFISIGPDQAWDNIEDLEEGIAMYINIGDISDRLIGLCPDWTSL